MPESEPAAPPAEVLPPQGEPLPAPGPELAATRTRVQAILAERLSVALPERDVDLIDGGFLDSLTLIELLFELEREFDLRFSLDDLDLESFRTVDRIAELIGAQRGRGAG